MTVEQTPTQRLYAVVEQGLCVGCGLCQSVAGEQHVSVMKTLNGYEQPVVVGELDHQTVDKILDVCPGTHVEGLPKDKVEENTKIDNVWGPWRRLVLSWASDPKVRFEGSTAGVLTALAGYLLKSRQVDFILHTRSSAVEPSFGEATLSFNHAQVLEAAGSRYGPSATLINISSVLDRNQPFAFIGKPCDIAALRNFSRHDSRVEKLVKYYLTPVCGGIMQPLSTIDFIKRNGMEPEKVTHFRYRGRGCPGPTRIESNEVVKEVHYLDFWGEDATQWALPFRCKICPDEIGEAADIAAADTWFGGSPTRQGSLADPGENAFIARTMAGQELLEAAAAAGVLSLGQDVTPDEMSGYQPHQMRKKYAAWSRFQGIGDEGRIVPHVERLRIQELAEDLTDSRNEYQRNGTRQRIIDGKVQEPTPKPWKL